MDPAHPTHEHTVYMSCALAYNVKLSAVATCIQAVCNVKCHIRIRMLGAKSRNIQTFRCVSMCVCVCAFVSVFVCIEHDKLAHPFIIISSIRSPPHPFISSRGCFDQHSLCYSFSVQLCTTVDSSQPFTNCFALLVLHSLLGLSYSYDLFSPSNFIVHRSRSPRPSSLLHLTYVA